MKEIEEDEFYNLIKTKGTIEFRIIKIKNLNLKNFKSIEFISCVFVNNLNIYDEYILDSEIISKKTIYFKDCVFNTVSFSKCDFAELTVLNTKMANKFRISNCRINKLNFIDCNDLNSVVEIVSTDFLDVLNFENNHFSHSGRLFLHNCKFFKESIFHKNTFSTLGVSMTKFKEFVTFNNNLFSNKVKCDFFICEFQQVDFSKLQTAIFKFLDCKFYGDGLFLDIKYSIQNEINFENCVFEKNFLIDKSAFYKFYLLNVKFKEISSFQNTFFDKISFENVIFEKQANFDDIQIKQVYDCDRKTIRSIKLQLQKGENKIDYNKFRVYEFNAYRNDIKKKLKEFEKDNDRFYHRKREPTQLKRDLFILWISDVVSEYGTDWKRALQFSLISGFTMFSIFFVIENYQYPICFANWPQFISGLFRFFLVTDFFNPLVSDRVYLTNPLSWFVFILGKIVIAFGIYEMIQSFRKFKA